jgi:hypothetical protein
MNIFRKFLVFLFLLTPSVSYSQSISIDAGYPTHVATFFGYAKIRVLGTFSYPSNAMPPGQVLITYKLGSNPQQNVSADYDSVSKKFGKWSSGSIVPLEFPAPGKGTVSIVASGVYQLPNPNPPPTTISTTIASSSYSVTVP